MKIFKIFISKICCVFLFLILVIFAGCTPKEVPPSSPEPYPYDDDFICGYFLTFRDDNNPEWVSPSSNDFESKYSVKVYATLHYPSTESNKGWLFTENGLPVNTGILNIEGDPLCENKSGAMTLHDKIYFTSELNGKTVIFNAVMYNAAERKTYTTPILYGTITSGVSIMFGRELEALVDDGNGGLVNIKYTPDFSVTFERVDKLCGIEINQYDEHDEKLTSNVYSEENFNSIPYVFSADTEQVESYPSYALLNSNTQYVIIKKTYENYLHEQYSERIILNNKGNSQTTELLLPLGGLVTSHEILFNFPFLPLNNKL